MEIIRQQLLQSDMVVFATPLYYYGMTAQLKTVVDRFCAYNSSLNRRHIDWERVYELFRKTKIAMGKEQNI